MSTFTLLFSISSSKRTKSSFIAWKLDWNQFCSWWKILFDFIMSALFIRSVRWPFNKVKKVENVCSSDADFWLSFMCSYHCWELRLILFISEIRSSVAKCKKHHVYNRFLIVPQLSPLDLGGPNSVICGFGQSWGRYWVIIHQNRIVADSFCDCFCRLPRNSQMAFVAFCVETPRIWIVRVTSFF